jgi:hypothetical protein
MDAEHRVKLRPIERAGGLRAGLSRSIAPHAARRYPVKTLDLCTLLEDT